MASDSATAMVTELAVLFAAEKVSIGLIENQVIRLLAISHQAKLAPDSTWMQQVRASMEEVLLQRVTLVYPERDAGGKHILLAHSELARQRVPSTVCTVPLARAGEVFGALTFERRAERPFTDSEVAFFEHVAAFLGPVLKLKWDTQKSWWQLVKTRLPRSADAALGSRRWGLGATAAVVLLCITPLEYRVSAPARLEGISQRSLAAPADGYIKQVHVRAGDLVKQGQVLAELSQDEFLLERQRRQSDFIQLQSALGDALAKHDYSQIGVLSAKVSEARAYLSLVEEQLQRTRITAPFDGVILTGDLTRAIGAPVRQGESLFVLSPSLDARVIVEVDESDISDIELGRKGELSLSAYPGQALPIKVKRITPMANTKEDRNYFEVEAQVDAPGVQLRPGLQGVAKVDVERRFVFWIIGHDAWNWLRLKLWAWWG